MEKDFFIIIVDDNIGNKDPLYRWMIRRFSSAEVKLFNAVEDSISFIFSHLESKIIVFMDCKFDVGLQGVQGLEKIRQKTSLVSIVMMSANALNQMENTDLEAMINSKNLYFVRNNDMLKAESIVKEIQNKWISELDCVLEQWVKNHDGHLRDKPYMRTNKGILSLNDILQEIRKQTSFGVDLEKNILQVAIDFLTKESKQ